ncbi:D-Ala-D-Ala carboxypeptidase family metallohydrolase [Rhizobium yanglingense]
MHLPIRPAIARDRKPARRVDKNALYAAPKQNLVGGLAGLLEKASLPGMTRVAPNGLHIQNGNVEVGCVKPGMLNVIKAVETHFGKPVIVTSGYRDAGHNRMVGGAERIRCTRPADAADIKIEGVSNGDIAAFIRSLAGPRRRRHLLPRRIGPSLTPAKAATGTGAVAPDAPGHRMQEPSDGRAVPASRCGNAAASR